MTDKYAGHTEGPWTTARHFLSIFSDTMKICDVRGWGYLTGKGIGALGLSDEEAIRVQAANARLIADAPKLLKENKRLREALVYAREMFDVLEMSGEIRVCDKALKETENED